MLRIRLRRTGAKKKPTYRVVVADARSPRDGAFLDILGHYNPRTEPSTVVIDAAKAQRWLLNGAQPSDRVARLFQREGIASGSAGAVATAEAPAPPAEAAAPSRARARRTAAPAEAASEEAPAEPTASAAPAEAPASGEVAEAADAAAPVKRPTRRRAASAEGAEEAESAADAAPLDSTAAKEEA